MAQAHVKTPTLGGHQRLTVGWGVRQAFHEAGNFTLANGAVGRHLSPIKISCPGAGAKRYVIGFACKLTTHQDRDE